MDVLSAIFAFRVIPITLVLIFPSIGQDGVCQMILTRQQSSLCLS